tara:strand:+ start:986 stop:1225 length:240 start_codon:yes stop_codon:yes gene_type:complete
MAEIKSDPHNIKYQNLDFAVESFFTEKQKIIRKMSIQQIKNNSYKLDEILIKKTNKFTHGKFHQNFRGSKYRGVTINGN